jgi:hypothetical protein
MRKTGSLVRKLFKIDPAPALQGSGTVHCLEDIIGTSGSVVFLATPEELSCEQLNSKENPKGMSVSCD